MGTLSKALGSYGGYVACSALHKDWMINTSRSLIFSTALPPASLGAALGAQELIQEGSGGGSELLDLARWFCEEARTRGFTVSPTESQIVPVQVGSISQTVEVAQELRHRGIWVFAIRPPTVPAHSSCIRFSLTRGHTRQMCTQALDQLHDVLSGLADDP